MFLEKIQAEVIKNHDFNITYTMDLSGFSLINVAKFSAWFYKQRYKS